MENGELIVKSTAAQHLDNDVEIDSVIDGFLATKRSENTRRAYLGFQLGRGKKQLLSLLRSSLSEVDFKAVSKDPNLFEYLDVTSIKALGKLKFYQLVELIEKHLKEGTTFDDDTGRPINPKTTNRKAYAISSFFKYLIHAYGYPKNPLEQYQAFKVERKSTTKSLTRAEIVDVLKYFSDRSSKSQTAMRNYLSVCFLTVLALRRNELVGLKWTDINFQSSSVNVYQKGGSYKLLPIPTALLEKLKIYETLYRKDCVYVFTPVRNTTTKTLDKPISSNYIYELVKRVVFIVTNGKKATPHSFRKSFIEMALNNQEDFISIINATGHSTVEMVKYYDTRDSLKNNAVHSMGKLI